MYNFRWKIVNELAGSSRPGYDSIDRTHIELDVVTVWIEAVKQKGIRSIICLLPTEQLDYYKEIPGGLIGIYQANGFTVENFPIKDPAEDPEGWNQLNNKDKLEEIYKSYLMLPKPVLVHCSAGQDRTGRVLSYIETMLNQR